MAAGSNPLFRIRSSDVRIIKKAGSVVYGTVDIDPDIWIMSGNKNVRLVDILGLTPKDKGLYVLPIRGVETADGIKWSGKVALDRLLARVGIQHARTNGIDFPSFYSSYLKGYHQIINSKLQINMAALASVYSEFAPEGYSIKVSAGQVYKQVDLFAPIDDRIGAGREFSFTQEMEPGSNRYAIENYSQYKMYGSTRNELGGNNSFVSNTYLSYFRIQDVDSDTISLLQFQLMKGTEVVGSWFFDKKWPHSTHQMGSFSSVGRPDVEGDTYSPYKIARRMRGAISNGLNPKHPYAEGNAIRMLIAGTRDIAAKMATSSHLNKETLAKMISKSIREEIIGIATDKQWLKEALLTENLLQILPEFLAEHPLLAENSDQVAAFRQWIAKDANKVILMNQLNAGLSHERRIVFEDILKAKKTDDDSLEVLGLSFALDYQDRILQKGDTLKYGMEEAGIFGLEWMNATSPVARAGMLLGTRDKRFVQGKAFKMGESRPIKQYASRKSRSGQDIGKLVERLRSQTVYDKKTGTFQPLLQIQEVDLTPYLSEEYLGQIDPRHRDRTGKAYAITFNNFDTKGDLTRSPLAGAHHTTDGSFRVHVLGPAWDPINNEMVDPLFKFINRVEQILEELGQHLPYNRYGYGELTGDFSVERLASNRGFRQVALLSEATGVSKEQIINLAKRGTTKEIEILKSYKATFDAKYTMRNSSSAQFQDWARVLKLAIGGLGLEATAFANQNGRIYFEDPEILKTLAQNMTISIMDESMDTERVGHIIAEHWKKNPIIAAVKNNPTYGNYITKRALNKNGMVQTLTEDGLAEAKRQVKKMGYELDSIKAGQFRIAITTTDVTPEFLERMAGSWAVEGIDRSTYDLIETPGARFRATHMDEGISWLTKSGAAKQRQAILQSLTPGVHYGFKREGQFVKPEKLYSELDGKYHTVYLRHDVELDQQRLVHNPKGTIRTVPGYFEQEMVDSTGRQIDMVLSVGEYLSKGGNMRELLAEMEDGAEQSFDEIFKGGFNAAKAEAWLAKWKEKLGTTVTSRLTADGKKEKMVESGVLILTDELSVRSTSADEQIHRMSSFGEWDTKLRNYAATHRVGGKDTREVLENLMYLKGKTFQDTFPEFARGFHSWLRESNAIDPTMSVYDLTDALIGRGRSKFGSLTSQMALEGPEKAIERIVRNMANEKGFEADFVRHSEILEMDARSVLNMAHGSYLKQQQTQWLLGGMKAMAEVGIELLKSTI